MLKAGDRVQGTVQLWREAGALSGPHDQDFITRYAAAYRNEMDHFADILAGQAEPATGYADSVRSLRLAEAARQSMRTGLPVRL
jgi:myo-inositol 2-dehydrogenase / D-chiro-inositol 1-dehydrogenase